MKKQVLLNGKPAYEDDHQEREHGVNGIERIISPRGTTSAISGTIVERQIHMITSKAATLVPFPRMYGN
jgi:hypothetical protein